MLLLPFLVDDALANSVPREQLCDECLPGRCPAVLAQRLNALDDAIDVFLRGRGSPLGLLLERIDDVDSLFELNRVDLGIAIAVGHDLQHLSALELLVSSERLR
ncbi:hypothetical protein JOE50_008040 [Bradyrhizobium japonicum]|nr:hypothetical protein [Bradyrhizobium japonicum]